MHILPIIDVTTSAGTLIRTVFLHLRTPHAALWGKSWQILSTGNDFRPSLFLLLAIKFAFSIIFFFTKHFKWLSLEWPTLIVPAKFALLICFRTNCNKSINFMLHIPVKVFTPSALLSRSKFLFSSKIFSVFFKATLLFYISLWISI